MNILTSLAKLKILFLYFVKILIEISIYTKL